MIARRFPLGLLVAVGCLAAVPALGHGASRGLHLHVEPATAAPGETVEVSIDARRPLEMVRLGVAGEEGVVEIEPDPPARHVETRIEIPATADGTVSLHAEATTTDGRTVRAAAIVTIEPASSDSAARSPRRFGLLLVPEGPAG